MHSNSHANCNRQPQKQVMTKTDMTTKHAKSSSAEKLPAKAVEPKVDKSRYMEIVARPGVSEDRLLAEHAFDSTSANASTALDYSKNLFTDLNLQECANVMKADMRAVNGGDLDKLEGMLTGQAMALNAMFNNFAKRAIHATQMPQLEAYTRLALKAQSQCRTTVEAIAEIKYPKSATFIKQANIAQQQQVNNERPANSSTHEKDITPAKELLTESSGTTLKAPKVRRVSNERQ